MLIEGLLKGDVRKIMLQARDQMKEEGFENWNVHYNTVKYHIRNVHGRKYSITGIIVRELTLKLIAENRKKEEQIKAEVAAT